MIGVSPDTEIEMGKTEWERIKEEFGPNILPTSDKVLNFSPFIFIYYW
jgi:hypothetical protein